MAGDVLSQDEVDALLQGVSADEEDAAPGPETAGDEGAIRPYDIASRDRVIRGRLPTLELINDRFARELKPALYRLMRRHADISIGVVKMIKYSEFIRPLPVPASLNIMQVPPLRGSALFVFEPNLVHAVVDAMFGGAARANRPIEGRDFTQTEQRIIRRLLDVASAEYQRAWQPVHALAFDFQRTEMQSRFVSIASPNDIVVVSSFSIALGSVEGDLHLCLPLAMLEPLREALNNPIQGDQPGPDGRWLDEIATQVKTAEVELSATLARFPTTLGQLMQLRVGDVIAFEREEVISAEIDGIPVLECRYGTSGTQYAIQVERVLANHPKSGL
jgi:flagellar motor switch protein FliM